MPRTYLTAEQRLSARYDKRARLLGDKLAVFKARQHLTNREIGRTLGIRDETISRIINGDRTVRLPLEVLWRIEDMVKIMESPQGGTPQAENNLAGGKKCRIRK